MIIPISTIKRLVLSQLLHHSFISSFLYLRLIKPLAPYRMQPSAHSFQDVHRDWQELVVHKLCKEEHGGLGAREKIRVKVCP